MSNRVLIVDDDPAVRNLVRAILEDLKYEVIAAEDGEQALQLLEAEPTPLNFKFFVLDVVMPGMNGLDLLTRLRLQPKTQSTPVLMLTGEDKAEDILGGYNVGADYYITKPFTRQQLMFGIDLVCGKGS